MIFRLMVAETRDQDLPRLKTTYTPVIISFYEIILMNASLKSFVFFKNETTNYK
jgi:hypothetical protein